MITNNFRVNIFIYSSKSQRISEKFSSVGEKTAACFTLASTPSHQSSLHVTWSIDIRISVLEERLSIPWMQDLPIHEIQAVTVAFFAVVIAEDQPLGLKCYWAGTVSILVTSFHNEVRQSAVKAICSGLLQQIWMAFLGAFLLPLALRCYIIDHLGYIR